MNNRLQELTDKLYNEGLSKGKAEGEALLAQAKEKAAANVEEARKEAEAIVGKARKDAEELSEKVSKDIRMASSQSMQATRMDIENLVVSKMVDTDVKKAMSSADFLKEVIIAGVALLSRLTLPSPEEPSCGSGHSDRTGFPWLRA